MLCLVLAACNQGILIMGKNVEYEENEDEKEKKE
jgi:hypothetical protein